MIHSLESRNSILPPADQPPSSAPLSRVNHPIIERTKVVCGSVLDRFGRSIYCVPLHRREKRTLRAGGAIWPKTCSIMLCTSVQHIGGQKNGQHTGCGRVYVSLSLFCLRLTPSTCCCFTGHSTTKKTRRERDVCSKYSSSGTQ